jgi:hypothetical protein
VADAVGALHEGFREHLGRILVRHEHLLDKVDQREARQLGRRAAEAALAPLLWGEAVGARWDTTETAEFLGVTRQALHDRVRRGTLLGLPGRGVTWFPVWQFDPASRRARPVVPVILQLFRLMDRPLGPIEIASWAQEAQPELDGSSPADWITSGRADESVVGFARRSAARVAV